MFILPSNVILSPCRKLIWSGSRNNNVIEKIRNINKMDLAIRDVIASENDALEKRHAKLPSGEIDGIIFGKLLYIAVSDTDEEKEWHLLHLQKLMSETKTLRECLLLTVNKNTGSVTDQTLPFNRDCVVDFVAISKETVNEEKDPNDSCHLCPFYGECWK